MGCHGRDSARLRHSFRLRRTLPFRDVKLKRLPEDFRVTELSEVQTDGGEFALYRLRKTSIGTLEAIEELQRRWNLQRNRVSWGGLKDRHAVTEQFVTVRGGPQRNHREKGIELTWLGRTRKPFTLADIHGNRFEIVIRDLSTAEALRSQTALGQVAESGVPNYFDDQRFGSVGETGEFIGRPWCQGDYEQALWNRMLAAFLRERLLPDALCDKRITDADGCEVER